MHSRWNQKLKLWRIKWFTFVKRNYLCVFFKLQYESRPKVTCSEPYGASGCSADSEKVRFSSESLYLLMFTRTLLRRTFPLSFSFLSSPSSLPRQQWPFLFADKPKDTGFFLKIFLLIGLRVCLFSYLPWNATQSLITDLLRTKKWQNGLET